MDGGPHMNNEMSKQDRAEALATLERIKALVVKAKEIPRIRAAPHKRDTGDTRRERDAVREGQR